MTKSLTLSPISLNCIYAKRLLGKLEQFNRLATTSNIDITEVKKAIYYAKKYHGEQLRASGEPYYSHPLEVASLVSDYLFDTDMIVTAILHDTLEDTDLTFSQIKKTFGLQVANYVQDLTRIKEGYKITAAEMIEQLWREKKVNLIIIKQCDRLHNLQTIAAKPANKIHKTLKESANFFMVAAVDLGISSIEKQISKLCKDIANSLAPNQLREIPFGTNEDLLDLLFQNDVSRNNKQPRSAP